MTMLDDFTLRADQAAALYLDLSNAELDATGLAMLEEQERRRQQKILKYVQADIDRVVAAMVKPDDMVCPEKPKDYLRECGIPAHLIAPLPKPAPPATEAGPAPTEFMRWACSNVGCCTNRWRVMKAENFINSFQDKSRAAIGHSENCGHCSGTITVIACDKDGRELVGKRRYFKAAPEMFWEFSERYPRGACYTKVCRNPHPGDSGLEYCLSTYEELHGADAKHAADVADELDALLGKSDA